MQIPIFRDPLRDTAESVQGGLNAFATGLMRYGQKKDQEDTEARLGAGQLRGDIAREIARLSAIPEESEEKLARLEELTRLDGQLNSVFAAKRQGDASSLWSRVMAESGIAPTLGAASGAATSLERDLEDTRQVQGANANILSGFVSFLANPDLNDPQFMTKLNAQLALFENLVGSGFALPKASETLLSSLPQIISGFRGALASDPRYTEYLSRLDTIQAAAAQRAGIEVARDFNALANEAFETGVYPPEYKSQLVAAAGVTEAEFDARVARSRERAESMQIATAEGARLANERLGLDIDATQMNNSITSYRNDREMMLDNVKDMESAKNFVAGAIGTGDVTTLTSILRELEDPSSPRHQYWLAAGLTPQGVRDALNDATQNKDYLNLTRDTAKAEATRALAAATSGVATDAMASRQFAVESAARGLRPTEVESWFDGLDESYKNVLMAGNTRESTINQIKQLSRLNELAVSEPLRADAMGRAGALLALPIPRTQNNQLTPEGRDMMVARAEEMYDILLPEFGEAFASQYRAGAAVLLANNANVFEWEILALEMQAKLAQAQVNALHAKNATGGVAALDKDAANIYLDYLQEHRQGLNTRFQQVTAAQQQLGCVGFYDSGRTPAVWVAPSPSAQMNPMCQDYAGTLTQIMQDMTNLDTEVRQTTSFYGTGTWGFDFNYELTNPPRDVFPYGAGAMVAPPVSIPTPGIGVTVTPPAPPVWTPPPQMGPNPNPNPTAPPVAPPATNQGGGLWDWWRSPVRQGQ
jgi:hypothetical protein